MNFKQRKSSVFLYTLFLVSGSTYAAFDSYSYSMGASYLYGNLDGFLQTPAGGQPGSTSSKRPSFEELGFDQQPAFDAYGSMRRGSHEVTLGMQLQRQSGKSVLTEDLISQKQFFSAGSTVNADIQTDWYRLNYLYSLHTGNENLSLSAGGGLVWFNFDYQLENNDSSAKRAYSKIGYRIGGDLNWRLNDRFFLNIQIFGPIPLSNTPEIWTLETNAEYELWKSSSSRFMAVGGIGYNRIDYEDKQRVPNHIRVETAPYLRFGLKFEF